jgi:hypothetical protein
MKTAESPQQIADRAILFFRLQYTLFVFFYGVLVLCSVAWFKVRLSFIQQMLASERPLPRILEVSIALHHPVFVGVACILPLLLLIAIWVLRPSAWFLLGEVILIAVVATLAIVPPVATELTTASVLWSIHAKATESGLLPLKPKSR